MHLMRTVLKTNNFYNAICILIEFKTQLLALRNSTKMYEQDNKNRTCDEGS